MAKVTIPFDTYHDFDAMTGYLKALTKAHPKLAKLTSIAKSHRGLMSG
jgi:hypothetical protein